MRRFKSYLLRQRHKLAVKFNLLPSGGGLLGIGKLESFGFLGRLHAPPYFHVARPDGGIPGPVRSRGTAQMGEPGTTDTGRERGKWFISLRRKKEKFL